MPARLPMKLLAQRIPLSLLIDLAYPAGPPSHEILHAEQINQLVLTCATTTQPVVAVYATQAG